MARTRGSGATRKAAFARARRLAFAGFALLFATSRGCGGKNGREDAALATYAMERLIADLRSPDIQRSMPARYRLRELGAAALPALPAVITLLTAPTENVPYLDDLLATIGAPAVAPLAEIALDPNTPDARLEVVVRAFAAMSPAARGGLDAVPGLRAEERTVFERLIASGHGRGTWKARAELSRLIPEWIRPRDESGFTGHSFDFPIEAPAFDNEVSPAATEFSGLGPPTPGSRAVHVPVVATDATTGGRVALLSCAAEVDGATKSRTCGGSDGLYGERRPAAGAAVFAYADGYDLGEAPIGDAGPVEIRMRRSTTTATVRRAVDTDPAAPLSVMLAVLVRGPSGAKPGPRLHERVEVVPSGGGLDIALPAGAVVQLRTHAGGGLLAWPTWTTLVEGAVTELHAPSLRRIRIRSSRLDAPLDISYVRPLGVSLDRTQDPGWSIDAIDALTMWRLGGRWELERREGGLDFPFAPHLPFHLFLVVNDVPRYLPIGADEVDFALDPTATAKRVIGRPIVGGAPVPDRTILAPGCLDLDTNRAVSTRPARGAGYAHYVSARSAWGAVRLPSHPTLTVWHPSLGIAWLPWTEDAVPSGTAEPGRIVVTLGASGTTDGGVRVRSTWPGSGRVVTGGSLEPFVMPFDGRRQLVLPGLPLGNYELTRIGAEGAQGSVGLPVVVTLTRAVPDARASFDR